MRMNMKKLCAIGEALIDFIPEQKGQRLKDVPRFKRVAGGAPANVAASVAKLGGKAKFITQLGEDAFGDHIMEVFDAVGVDTSDIVRSKDANTALAFVSLAADGNRDFLFYRKDCADKNLDPKDISSSALKDCGILHFCSVDLVESPMKQSHKKLIDMAMKEDIIISFDPNVRLNLWDTEEACKDAIHEFLPYADIIKISDEELEFISGFTDIETALPFFFKDRCQFLIYTMGKDGARLYQRDHSMVKAKGYCVDVFDTTGAGDSFIGAFLYQLLSNDCLDLSAISKEELTEFLVFANLYAAHTTTKEGAIDAMATLEELTAFQKNTIIQ